MDRRNFLATSAAAAALVSLSGTSRAAETPSLPPVNLLFTPNNTGIWESKKATHIPHLEIKGSKVKVTTPHVMQEDHHIVRHTLLLADGKVVGGKTFTLKDQPISEYDLPAGYKGKIFATSFCNQHDMWLVEATV